MTAFDLELYMHPYWQGDTVYHETVMVIEQADGSLSLIPLLFSATEILSVRSSDLQTEYHPGTDYQLSGGKLQILPGSAIPKMSHAQYYPADETPLSKKRNDAHGGGFIFFSEGSLMHTLQIAVTYRHQSSFDGPVPPCQAALLPKTTDTLRTGGTLQICLYGDSICVGGNASGFVEAPPFAPTWFDMVCMKLQKQYPGVRFHFHNPSLGGMTSQWGAEEATARVGYGPDLCIIGFGMNDGTKRLEPAQYLKNIQAIMAAARQNNPDCEFLLIAPTVPNKEVGRFWGYQTEYLPVLQSLQESGVAVADMTGFHQFLLTKKRFYDMSDNNLNHPNDFLSRAYAQVIWQTIIGNGSEER